jgi:sn-glycerol 3-phosphate transport system permease protein
MSSIIPLLTTGLAALAGAAFMVYMFRQLRQNPALGAVIGAAAGAAGSLIFMLPLNYCTFETERAPIDLYFGIILIVVGVAAALALTRWLVLFWFNRNLPGKVQQSQPGVYKGWLIPVALLAPTIIILALFLYYPSLDTFRLSTLLARLGARRTAFVCVDNFTSLVSNPDYYNSLVITILMSLAIVVIGLALSLLIATMAYQPVKGARIYRTLLVWPYAISPVVAGLIFLLLFNPTGGLINYFLGRIGIQGPGWLNDPNWAPWAVITASVWKQLGYNILFYIAGLQNVPKDLQEAGAIDGANAFQRFFMIVVPLLSPITFFLVITNMTYAFFESFGTIDALTGGGPLESTTTLMYQIYEVGVQNNDLGKAAAQSIVLFAMVIGLTILQFRTTGERVNYGA